MAEYELDRYLDLTEQELKAAKVVLAAAISPLLFYLSTLGYLPSSPVLSKWVATISVLSFLIASLAWGIATTLCQLTLTSVQFERLKGREGDDLRAFIKTVWNRQNDQTAKLFKPASIFLAIGYLTLALFVGLLVWRS